jgi:hypothetical protein
MKIKITLSLLLFTVVMYSQNDLNYALSWEFNEKFRQQQNSVAAAEVFDRIYELDSTNVTDFWSQGVICYDKANPRSKALNLISIMADSSNYSFCIKEYSELFQYSEEILQSEIFTSNCKTYDYLINQPCDYEEYRDTLMKYLILSSNLRNKSELYIKMGYEEYYPTSGKLLNMHIVDRIIYFEKKIDSLVGVHGYPTRKMMIDKYVPFTFELNLIHSTNAERLKHYLENYENDLPNRPKAYMSDKLAVMEDRPQIYGTQFKQGEMGLELYPGLPLHSGQ